MQIQKRVANTMMFNYKTNWFYSKDTQIHRRNYSGYVKNDYGGLVYFVTNNFHTWLQDYPLSENKVVCRDCKVSTRIGKWDNNPCTRKTVKLL